MKLKYNSRYKSIWTSALFVIVFLCMFPFNSTSQQKRSPDYYLVDKLEIQSYSIEDKTLVEQALKKFHATTSPLKKIESLSAICENMEHDDWCKYQLIQKKMIEEELKHSTSLAYTKKLDELLATALMNLGYFYDFHGDISKGLSYYFKSLKIVEKINDPKQKADLYNNIGFVYNNQGYRDKGLDYYQKGLKILEEIDDSLGIAEMNNNIGFIYYYKGDSKKAIRYFQHSLQISTRLNDSKGAATALNNIGYIESVNGNTDKSLKYYFKSLALYQSIHNELGIAHAYNNIASLLFKLGKVDEAEEYSKKGLMLSIKQGVPDDISTNAALLSKISAKKGKYKDAYEMLFLTKKMTDSINNLETVKTTATQQAKYEYEKQKALDYKEYEKKIAVAQEAKKKQKVIIISSVSGLILLTVFLFFSINRLQITRKQKNIIEMQKRIVETKNEEIHASITYAKRIQEAILPSRTIVQKHLSNGFIFYKPKDIVAGDFYWIEKSGNALYFAAADCTGHGVPGAMVSVICANALSKALLEENISDTGKILDRTRELVVEQFSKSEENVQDGMDISLCKISGNTLDWSGANNPLWIIRKGASEVEETKPNKQPIGKSSDQKPFTSHQIKLNEGDLIYIFTDGYQDQFGGEKGKKFKAEQLKKLLLSIKNQEIAAQKETIKNTFESWRGKLEQVDDVCVIGVRV